MVTIDDGFGTFTVERPRAETARVDPREGTAGVTPRTPNLRIGFSALEQIYGHDQLAAERAERRAEREALAASTFPASLSPRIFVCGPTPFVEAVAGWLVELGHDPAQIRTERLGGSP